MGKAPWPVPLQKIFVEFVESLGRSDRDEALVRVDGNAGSPSRISPLKRARISLPATKLRIALGSAMVQPLGIRGVADEKLN